MMRNGAVEVKVFLPDDVKPSAHRLLYYMHEQKWTGDVEAISLLQQLIAGCGVKVDEYIAWDPKPKYVLLEGLAVGNRFFSENPNSVEDDPRFLETGMMVYRILGYAETLEEAQTKLYGRTSPLV